MNIMVDTKRLMLIGFTISYIINSAPLYAGSFWNTFFTRESLSPLPHEPLARGASQDNAENRVVNGEELVEHHTERNEELEQLCRTQEQTISMMRLMADIKRCQEENIHHKRHIEALWQELRHTCRQVAQLHPHSLESSFETSTNIHHDHEELREQLTVLAHEGAQTQSLCFQLQNECRLLREIIHAIHHDATTVYNSLSESASNPIEDSTDIQAVPSLREIVHNQGEPAARANNHPSTSYQSVRRTPSPAGKPPRSTPRHYSPVMPPVHAGHNRMNPAMPAPWSMQPFPPTPSSHRSVTSKSSRCNH